MTEVGQSSGKMLVVYIQDEKHRQPAMDFFSRAFSAVDEVDIKRPGAGRDFAGKYDSFTVVMREEPERPCEPSWPNAVWYSI